jgi:glutamine synthetase
MAEKEKFALENPIQLITNKDRNDLTREDLIKVILEKQIERITFHYTGIDGKLKELRIPVTSRRQIELILSEGERTDGSSLFKGMIDAGKSDLYVVPVYRTSFINPFDPTSLNIICRFLDSDGNLAEFAPDNILHKAANNLRSKTGLEHQALGELEFYLIGHHENSTYPLAKQKGYHATAPFAKSTEIVNEMLRYMTQITGAIKYAHNEVGFIPHLESDFAELKGKSAEQVEIEFLLSNVEDTADIMVLAGWLVRNVAYRKGFVASFFPKIEVQQAGNGLHFHNALLREGKNIMTNTNGELSPEAINLIGGMSHYATSLNAFGNMVSSSYLRLVPHQEAPTKVCWSQSNRSALIRVPLAWTNTNNLAMKLNPTAKGKTPG